MKELEPSFPKFKTPQKKKSKFIQPMSEKTKDRLDERKQIVEDTHKRSGGKCEFQWMCQSVPCSQILHCDESHSRGRSGGTSQYDLALTQSICQRCDFVKENEVAATEILGLWGEHGKAKHEPINPQMIVGALYQVYKCKSGLHF